MAAMINPDSCIVFHGLWAIFHNNVGGKAVLGKPYFLELEQLEETYAFAMDMDIQPLVGAVSASMFLPLLVVGSGGSLTVARLIASIHQRLARMIAKPVTPLDLFENNRMALNTAIWFTSAGGRNTDIQAAIRSAISGEPRRLLVTCAKTASPLAIFAGKYNYTDVFEFDLPSQRDGFLATNSLLAFSVLFVRAYLDIFENAGKLPPDFRALMGFESSLDRFLGQLREQCYPLLDRENLVVLYGNGAEAAAYDLVSKFTEAALGPVQISDFRNFAHGRHHWLAKRGKNSAVAALTTLDDRKLAQKTLDLLPQRLRAPNHAAHESDTSPGTYTAWLGVRLEPLVRQGVC
jgi:fructoselysine-6-P-deglycase FrlB-like protein